MLLPRNYVENIGAMKKVLNFFTHPIVISLFGLMLLSLLIWFAGPYFKFGSDNVAPLETPLVRLVCIMVIMMLWGLNNLRIQMQSNKNNKDFVEDLAKNQAEEKASQNNSQATEEVAQLGQRFNDALDTLKKTKFTSGKGKKALYELPWYIIVGPPGSGKTTALVNSGLEFPLAEEFGKGALQGVGGTRNCDWWFTNSAVLIDTAGRYTTQDSHRAIDSSAWEGFLNLLKRNRRRRPINGAIVAISLQDLLMQTEEERILHAKTIRKRLDELMDKLQVRFPVYLMFTKVDLVSGFREFFEGLRREDRDQVWGVSLPNAPLPNQSPDFDYMDEKLNDLMSTLYNQVLWQVHQERNINRRVNIYSFPQQMESIKGIAESFVKQTFSSNRFQFQPYLRGVYFTSGTQDGTPIDRMMSAVSSNFGFSRESAQAPGQQGKSFFLTRLFQDVIFPESELVGANIGYEKMMRWAQRGTMIGLSALTVVVLSVWGGSVQRNKSFMADVETKIAEFEDSKSLINDRNKDIRTVLPALNALYEASHVYNQTEHPWLSGIGLYDARIDNKADKAYALNLRALMLPKLLASLEDVLAKGHDGGDIYNTFRLYMMFQKVDKMDKGLVADWFSEQWDAKYPGEGSRRRELVQHLSALLAQDIPATKLDERVVRSTRNLLLQVPAAQRIYARVKTNPMFTPKRDLLAQFGESARSVFKIDESARRALSMPVLFTKDGYEAADFTPNSPVLNDVTAERWVLADSNDKRLDFVEEDLTDMSKEVEALYMADYAGQWQKAFKALKIAPFKSLENANDVLLSVTDPVYSPFKAVFFTGLEHTELTPSLDFLDTAEDKGKGKVKKVSRLANLAASKREVTPVDKRFKDMHILMKESSQGQLPIEVWLDRIGQMQVYVSEVSLSPDPSKKAYEIVKARYQSGAANPIATLKNYARSAPAPMDDWLRSLSDESWRVIMRSARQYVNTQWRNQVYSTYTSSLKGRYPLSKTSTDELALFDFVEFFKPAGQLDLFYKEFINPFVDTSNNWRNRSVDGYSLGFSNSSIAQLRNGLAIKDIFFRANPETPTIKLSVKPYKMDEKDARFTMDIGDSRLTYNHGPKFWASLVWSGEDEDKRIRLVFEGLNGASVEQTYTGPWAWFHLIDASTIEKTSRSNVFNITFNVGDDSGSAGRSIVYQGKTESINNLFSNDALTKFKAPESL